MPTLSDPPQIPDEVTRVLAALRRWPDIEGADLLAADGADRLLLDELASPGAAHQVPTEPGAVTVLDDAHGALTLGAVALGAQAPRVWQDSLVAERALDANAARLGLGGSFVRHHAGAPGDPLVPASALDGARLVLVRLPRSLAALTELAEAVAQHAAPDVVLLATGMVKHMTPTMNEVLGRCFTDVHATRGRYKARALVASGPRPDVTQSSPVSAEVYPGLTVWAYGTAFAGPRLDRGAHALLDALELLPGAGGTLPGAEPRVLDLGCGTGVLATCAALANPGAQVVATDVSAAAVASTTLTARAAGVGDRVTVVRDDTAGGFADDSFDAVLCNPPFHVGAAVHTGAAERMIRAAARVLRPGGTLWTVYNSHLQYRGELTRVVGSTTQLSRDRTFTVNRSVARTGPGAGAHPTRRAARPPEVDAS